MNSSPQIRALLFDVFGTCVNQRGSVADELWHAASAALQSKDSSINDQVRSKAAQMSYEQWFEFGGEWNKVSDKFVHECHAKGKVEWKTVDQNRIRLLRTLLVDRGLIVQDANGKVDKGSLWDDEQLEHLGRIWHRLTPWPDTCPGLERLNKKYETATLSNTYNELLVNLVAHGGMPFKHVYSADLFQSFKPTPKVYLGAAEKLGLKPEECGLVAAHLFDLKAAKACGFGYVVYVDRPLEEKDPELLKESIPDHVIEQSEKGFLALAEHLEC